uniref:TrbI/VirB10 family protein n=1 Tax=Cupriavidus gilardii TaxID=82541 RepID=UPI002479DB3A|nr:TrbI/VirB10 family protein [Cupriavidus gilardii]WDE72630.1 Conjugative transfer protein TrbI [Cupriavidus gilardii]
MSDTKIDPALLASGNPTGTGGRGFSLRPEVQGITRLNNRILLVAVGVLVAAALVGTLTFNSIGQQAGDAARNAAANQGNDQSRPPDRNRRSMWYMEKPDTVSPAAGSADSAGGASAPPASDNAAQTPPGSSIPDLNGKGNTLAGAIVNAKASSGANGGDASAAVSQAEQQAAQQRLQDAMQASKAELQARGFNSQQDPLAAVRAQAAAAAAAAAQGGSQGPTGGLIPTAMSGAPDNDQNKQERKEKFLKAAKQADVDYNPSVRTGQITPYEIKAGWVIPAVLISGMNSDLPGPVIAQVRENVYDSRSGKHLLIPQGSRLVGGYDSYVAYGQKRALVSWNRLIYPDGSSYNLRGMQGADAGGFAGFADEVDNHYARIFGSAVLMSLISAGAQLSQPNNTTSNNNNPNAGQTAAGALGQQLGQTGMQMAQKNLNIQPTIVIRPGYRFNVMVTADMALPRIDP